MKKKETKQPKINIKKGDTVEVISGNYKGKTGQVLQVFPRENRAYVEGINMVTKHVKPSANNTEGGRKQMEAPIHISNVMLVEPSTGEKTRVGRKRDDNGKLQRYSKKTGEIIS